ncbi:protein of unknown function [Cupriavidus neocaledonicus]|uniref:Ig-like domain-containing protein n=1 Tax=Cupriavidus neocaledonicus TaxID=1040979 RepID=A0A375H707_9BURK|nr:protein of unknown function [Cupriavidus neocaledonicus]
MNFYKRYTGDYARDTVHLSMVEDGAYNRLMDFYYSTEKPLPADRKAVYRIARATDKAEQKAVDSVLSEFFQDTGEGFRHKRIDAEIEKAKPKVDANRENGKKGGRPRKTQPTNNPPENPLGFQMETQTEPNGEPALVNHSHSQNKYKSYSGGVGDSQGVAPVDNSDSPPPLSADAIGEQLVLLEAERGRALRLSSRAHEALLRLEARHVAMPALLRAHALACARRAADGDPSPVNAEPFGTGDGAASQFQLLYQGQPVYQVDSAALYRNDWQGNQLLYPSPRTNYITRSEELDASAWNKLSTTITPNATTAPNGTVTADKIVETTAANTGHSVSSVAINVVATQDYYVSCFAKKAERDQVTLWIRNSDGSNSYALAAFDLTTGQVIDQGITGTAYTVTGTAMVSLGDGWYYCMLKARVDATQVSSIRGWIRIRAFGSVSYTGDGVSGLYAWGAQFSDMPGSYIPTTSAAATLTDYTLGPTGIAQLAVPPAAGAALTWTGDGEIYPSGTYVFIQDNQDMSMTIGVAGKVPSAVFLALLEGGYIPLKPEGVRVNYVIVTSVDGVPMFGFDVANQYVMGFDAGAWGTPL